MNILSDCPGIKYTNREKNNHEKKKKNPRRKDWGMGHFGDWAVIIV